MSSWRPAAFFDKLPGLPSFPFQRALFLILTVLAELQVASDSIDLEQQYIQLLSHMLFSEPQELLFIQDIFAFTLDPANAGKYVFCPQTYNTLLKNRTQVLLFRDESIIDSALLERLQMPNLNPLHYLYQTMNLINEKKDKPWFQIQEVQALAQISLTLVTNYLFTALTCPSDLFPDRLLSPLEAKVPAPQQCVARLIDLVFNFGLDQLFFHQALDQIKTQEPVSTTWPILLKMIVEQGTANRTIFSREPADYLSILDCCLSKEELKSYIFQQQDYPMLPMQNAAGPKKKYEGCDGKAFESQSLLGQFFQISIIQERPELLERAQRELGGKMTRNNFEAKLKAFQDIRVNYTQRLQATLNLCLRKSQTNQFDYFAEVIRLLRAVIIGNHDKLKEYFAMQKAQRSLDNMSSDGLVLNFYDVMLEVSRKIYNRADKKTYLLIDFNFWKHSNFPNEQPMLSSGLQQKNERQDFGNVTNLYFHTLKLAQVGLLATITTFQEMMYSEKDIEKVIKFLENQNDPMAKFQMEQEKQRLQLLQQRQYLYQTTLFDYARASDTFDLYDTYFLKLFELLNADGMQDGQLIGWQAPAILHHLPEFPIIDFCNLHLFLSGHIENYVQKYLNQDRVLLILKLTCLLLNLKIIDNKYVPGEFVELLFQLILSDLKRKALIFQCIQGYDFFKANFLIGVIDFYVKVGEMGDSSSFYVKFKYRYYINEVLIHLLQIQCFENQLRRYQETEGVQRLLRLMSEDINFCFEELWQKSDDYKKKVDELKNDGLPLKQRYQTEHEISFTKDQIVGKFSHGLSTLKLYVRITQVIPQTLIHNEIIRNQLLLNLNYTVNEVFKRENQEKVRMINDLLQKHKFRLNQFVFEIGKLYLNISESPEDQRAFKLSNFHELFKLFSSSANMVSFQELQSFDALLGRLQNQDVEFPIEELIDIPEMFSDPIMSTLITDPVRLPCGTIMDKKVIKASLLTNPMNPFTKQPLNESELVEVPELKKEIEAWIKNMEPQIKIKRIQKKREMELETKSVIEQFKKQQSRIQVEGENDEDLDESGGFQK